MKRSLSDIYNEIKSFKITTDSRQVQSGYVFIALKGEKFDGNEFAPKAISMGAEYAIIDNPKFQSEKSILVKNTLTFLQELAAFHRSQLKVKIIGITGTNGKTTTKELCNTILASNYKVIATEGNFNNHIGVPLTILRMTQDTEFGIIEMGANHPKEIKQLCDIADPDFGLITNVGYAHLEGFGDFDTLVQTKTALYRHIARKKGLVFVNSSDTLLMDETKNIKRITYGEKGQDAQGEIKQSVPYLVYSLKTLKGDLYIKTKLIGEYNFDNVMAASCIAIYFGINELDIKKSVEAYIPSNNRSQLIKTQNNTIILDAYNANLSSMNAAIINFDKIKSSHKIVILGEMKELGKISLNAHKEIVTKVIAGKYDSIFLVGDNFIPYIEFADNIRCFKTTEALIEYLKKEPIIASFIFIKGSRTNKLERLVDLL